MANDHPGTTSANNAASESVFREALEQAIDAVEVERNRLGSELHSGVAQDLTGLIFKLTEAQQTCSDPNTTRALAGTLKQVDQILERVRRISSRASPPMLKEIGLASALGWLTDYAPRHRGMECHVRCQVEPSTLGDELTQTIFSWTRWLIDSVSAQSVNVRVNAAPEHVAMQMEFYIAQPKLSGHVASDVTVFAITQRVQHAGGRITVRNAPDRASFNIELPAGKPHHGAWTVLLCEENEQVRAVTSAALAAHGCTVLAAGSAEEALKLADGAGNPVHLLVADVIMKNGSGRALFEQLRVRRPALRAIFMGAPGEQDEESGPEIQPNRILKPFAPQDLIQTIRRVLS